MGGVDATDGDDLHSHLPWEMTSPFAQPPHFAVVFTSHVKFSGWSLSTAQFAQGFWLRLSAFAVQA